MAIFHLPIGSSTASYRRCEVPPQWGLKLAPNEHVKLLIFEIVPEAVSLRGQGMCIFLKP